MRHSIIIKVGDNLVYQCAPNDKPMPESTSSPVEYNRALPEWEHTAKNYLIKKDDQAAFDEFMDVEKINSGIPVPFEFVETYLDGQKKYARLNKTQDPTQIRREDTIKPIVNPNANVQTSTQNKATITTEQPKGDGTLRVGFEITIDDETGEPRIKFNNNNRLDPMTQKLLKSFAIKGAAKGIELVAGTNGDYEIKITEKL